MRKSHNSRLKDNNHCRHHQYGEIFLFRHLNNVIFPSKLRDAINKILAQQQLQSDAHIVLKIIQLYETKNSRHSVMIVGQSGSGKSVTWRVLQATLSKLKKDGVAGYNLVRVGQRSFF